MCEIILLRSFWQVPSDGRTRRWKAASRAAVCCDLSIAGGSSSILASAAGVLGGVGALVGAGGVGAGGVGALAVV
jgi:hypothetical protein